MKHSRRRANLFIISILALFIILAWMFNEWFIGNYSDIVPFLDPIREQYRYLVNLLIADAHINNVALEYAIPFILFFISFSILSIFVLIFLLIIRRVNKIREEIVIKNKIARIQDSIIEYIYDDNKDAINKLMQMPKKLVVSEIVIVYENFIGNEAEKAKQLFYLLELDKFVLKKCSSIFWSNKIKYFQYAALLDISIATQKALENVNSKNYQVRNAAQLALLDLDSSHSFEFLNKIKRPLSKWQQMNIHYLLIRKSIPVPKFSEYLLSNNPTVVRFSLTMIRAFGQLNDTDKIIRLLSHPIEYIRHEALLTIKELRIKEAVPALMKEFDREDIEKLELDVIAALASIGTQECQDYLISRLPHKSFCVNMAILSDLSDNDKKRVLAKHHENKELHQICEHIADLNNR